MPEFDADSFNSFLAEIGVAVEWEKAMECPCRLSRSGATDVNCPVCEGIRFLWEAPEKTVIGVQGIKATQQWSQFGEWNKGDMIVTIGSDSPAYVAGEFDRFIITGADFRWNTVLTKGEKDRVKQGKIKKVERVIAIINDQIQEFVEFDHYTVEGNTIVWEATAGLVDKTQYSIRYIAAPEYFVYGAIPQDRAQFGRDLPRNIPLRMMDLFGQVVR